MEPRQLVVQAAVPPVGSQALLRGRSGGIPAEGGYIARTPPKPTGEGSNRQGYTGAPTESEVRNHSCGTDGREEIKEWAHPVGPSRCGVGGVQSQLTARQCGITAAGTRAQP